MEAVLGRSQIGRASSRCVQVIVKSAATARGAERGGPRRICGCRAKGGGWRGPIPRLSLVDGRSPTPRGWGSLVGSRKAPRGILYAFTKPRDAFKRVTRKGLGWCGCQVRVTCTTGEALFYFQSPVRSLWITCEVSPDRRVPGRGTLGSKSAL